MSLGDEQVFLSVIVEILKANAPARGYSREHGHSCLQAPVAEQSVAIVVEDGVGLPRQSCDNHVRLSIIIVILKYHAHAGQWSAVKVEGRASLERDFRKRSIAAIVEQILLHAVVGNIDVGKSIAV